MPNNKDNNILNVDGKIISDGIEINVENKKYEINFPAEIWDFFPDTLKKVLCENLCFANTHFLPLILNKNKIKYNFGVPMLESFFFHNQMYDLTGCEKSDEKECLEYVKKFYNLDFEYEVSDSSFVNYSEIANLSSKKVSAILPFTFGKESLATLALCEELEIEPILMYSQEPAHSYEEEYKKTKLQELSKNFGITYYYLKNDPGLFRYGLAFDLDFPE